MAEIILTIIALITLVGSLIGIWVNLNSRITIIEQQIKNLNEKYSDLLKMIKEDNQEVKQKLDSIESKLDDFNIIKAEHNIFKEKCLKINK